MKGSKQEPVGEIPAGSCFLQAKESIINKEKKKEDFAVKKCVIFCAGKMELPPLPIGPADLVIAADGGLSHAEKWGITPQVVLGDFDSLGYVPAGARVSPVEKDDTDAMLAVRLGLEKGYDRFVLYGALEGERVDHTLANFQLLLFLQSRNAKGWLVGDKQIVTVLREAQDYPARAKGIFSLFSMNYGTKVTITGLKYELTDGLLQPDFPLGVSNHFMDIPSRVEVKNGSLLAVYDRKNGILEE